MATGRAARRRQPRGADSGRPTGRSSKRPRRNSDEEAAAAGGGRIHAGKAWTQPSCWGANTLGRHSSSGAEGSGACLRCWPATWVINGCPPMPSRCSVPPSTRPSCPSCWREIQPASDCFEWARCDKQVQWCHRHGLKVIGGPLLPLDRDRLPDWVRGSNLDFAGLAKAARKFVDAAVERYRNQVHLWHVVAATSTAPWLGDDHKLRLTAMAVETARRRDSRTPVYVSVDQPWGEAMVFALDHDPAPVRRIPLPSPTSKSPPSAWRSTLGYWPGGSFPRNVLEVTEHIDLVGPARPAADPVSLRFPAAWTPTPWQAIPASFRRQPFPVGCRPGPEASRRAALSGMFGPNSLSMPSSGTRFSIRCRTATHMAGCSTPRPSPSRP